MMDTDVDVSVLEYVRADSLRFGDRLPYFGQHVRGVDNLGVMLRVHLMRRIGVDRTRLNLYPDDMVHVIRAGSLRGVA